MGNKLGRRRHVVDEKYTRPQGLYQIKDVDMKKLRKLILESKLAPCYPGDEECLHKFEECPICFLHYPSLNRSKCCTKGICTECFLQMKTPNSTSPTQCPFCKTPSYAVEYRGAKTKEERGIEQIEEQRVIEAKIRMRQQELQDDKERMHKRQEIISSLPLEVEYNPVAVPPSSSTVEVEEIASSQELCAAPAIRRPPNLRTNRDYESDVDLEDIMVMEAIWLSIQDNGRAYVDNVPLERHSTDRFVSPSMVAPSPSSSSPSGGLACAIASLAEHQQTGAESSIRHNRSRNRPERHPEHYSPTPSTLGDGEWSTDHGSDMAEAGTSYASSETTEDNTVGVSGMALHGMEGGFRAVSGAVVPESFEEQMMLAMAVSLAEARAATSVGGVAWR